MKNDQIARIEGFINSLEHNPMGEETQALVLQSELDLIGGDNSGNCTNSSLSACRGTNYGCKNYDGACGGSTNKKGCENTGSGPVGQ